jgi:GNAT superfamily N-acetyltransferase
MRRVSVIAVLMSTGMPRCSGTVLAGCVPGSAVIWWGFVNVAWDGGVHAFILDTLVAVRVRRRGIGTRLIATAAGHARAAGCEWLHVDSDDHLTAFYIQACGFTPTSAGLIALTGSQLSTAELQSPA